MIPTSHSYSAESCVRAELPIAHIVAFPSAAGEPEIDHDDYPAEKHWPEDAE